MATPLPRQDVPLVDSAQRPTTPWYVWMQDLAIGAAPTPTPPPVPVDPPEPGTVRGQLSIATSGVLPGIVYLKLVGDVKAPPALSYYGTGAAGAKGWTLITDALAELSTDDLPEGSNLYYTDARADGRVDAGIAAHVAEPDPHPQYLLRADLASLVNAVNDAAAAAAGVAVGALYRNGSILQIRVT